jgi:hypothetical protein
MLPALENFVNYGTQTLVQNRAYLDAMVDMVRTIFKDDKVGGVDRICGCKLAEIIMLNMRGHVDDYVPEFLGLAMQVLTNDEPKVKSLRIHLMEVIINSIYYNPALALHVLESNGWTNKFFSLWFSSIDNFTRVHDKKLCISAICALLTLNAQSVPVSVQQGWPRLLQGVVRLFQTLPAALKNREEAKREDNFDFANEYEDDEEDEEWEQEADWNNEADEEEIKDESAAYLEFLNEEAQKFGGVDDDDDDDELEEESLLETPLDKVEPYAMFKHALLRKSSGSWCHYKTDRTQNFNKSSLRCTRTLRRTSTPRSSKSSRAPFTRPTPLHRPRLLPPPQLPTASPVCHSSRMAGTCSPSFVKRWDLRPINQTNIDSFFFSKGIGFPFPFSSFSEHYVAHPPGVFC